AKLLQWSKDEERIDEQREELADGDLLREDEIEHQEQDAGPQGVDGRALDEAEAPQVAHLPQLESQDLRGRRIQASDLLLRQPQALHQLDVAQRFGRRPGKGRRLGNDLFLNHLDLAAQDRAEDAQQRHSREIDRRDQPVHGERVDHHENHADQRREQHVDRDGDQALDVGPDLLQLAERFSAPLVLERRVGQVERMPDAIRVQLRAEALGDEADDVVLEVLGYARDEGDADRRAEQQAHATEKFAGGIFLEPGRVLVDDVAEDQRIEQREDLVDGRQDERQRDQRSVVPEVGIEDPHLSGIIPCRSRRPYGQSVYCP